MPGTLDKLKKLFRREATSAEEVAEGGRAITRPPAGAGGFVDRDRETSTNAQAEGAADEPWGGNR
jgi:hypothetical protein